MLAEGSLTVENRDTFFGRFELSEKAGHELGLDDDDVAGVSVSIVPDRLKPADGSRVNAGMAVFLALRPAGRAPDDLPRAPHGVSNPGAEF